MKKFALFLVCFLAIILIAVCVLFFVPFSSPYEKGPQTIYRVEEGAIDVFSYRDGQVGSLMSFVKPGETFTARPISAAALEVPFAMTWMESVTIAAVGRANLFMLKQSKKSRYRDFAVAYTDESIDRGFTKEIEKTQVLSNVRMNFYSDGFSLFARAGGMPLSVRGYASTGGTSDRLFLRLRWVKLGRFFLPKHILRALENIFSKAYAETGHPSIKLYRIAFSDGKMVMFYKKVASNDVNPFQQDSSSSAPEIFYPYGDDRPGL
jgi:hypothetical protein